MSVNAMIRGADDAVEGFLTRPILQQQRDRYERILAAFERCPKLLLGAANAYEALKALTALVELPFGETLEFYVQGSFRKDASMGGETRFTFGSKMLGLEVGAAGETRTVYGIDAWVRAKFRIEGGLKVEARDRLQTLKPVELKEMTAGLLEDVKKRLDETPEATA